MTAFCAFMITASAMLGQSEATESTLPDNIVKEMEYFVGDWTVEGDVLGMPLKGRWTARWSPRKHCLLITNPKSLGGEKILGHGMMGWDTEKEEILVFMFFSDGVFEVGRYKLEAPRVLKGTFVGSAKGEPFTATATVRTDKPEEWTFQTKGNTVGGRRVGELSVRFIRSKSKPKGKKK